MLSAAIRRHELPLAALVASACVTLLYLTSPTIFEGEDYVKMHSLYREYLRGAAFAGRLPLWNPHVGLGRPFLADVETAAFYPPTLLALALDPHLALFLLLSAHATLSLLSTLRLCRYLGASAAAGWTVAVAFLGIGPVVGALHRGQIPFGQAIAYLPLALFLAARLQDVPSVAAGGRLALVLALQFLCGHPQMCWITWVALGAFLCGRGLRLPLRTGLRDVATALAALALALAAAAALAAVQLLPFLELVAQGNRPQPSREFAAVGSLPWRQWLSTFLPASLEGPLGLGADLYMGALLVLAGLAGLTRLRDRNVRGLALVFLAGVLISVGERTPLFALLYETLPGLSRLRFPGRMALLACLALLVPAAIEMSRPRPARSRLALPASIAFVMLAATAWWRFRLAPSADGPTAALLRVALILGAALLLYWLHSRPRRSATAATALLGVFALGDLAAANAMQKRFRGGPGPFPAERAVTQALADAGLIRDGAPPPRISVPYPLMRDNSGMRYGYSTFSGFVALTLNGVWTYIHEVLGIPPPLDANTYPSPEIWAVGPFPYGTMSLVLGYDPRSARLAIRPDPDPRAYLVPAAEVVPGVAEAVARIKSGHDLRQVALLGSPLEVAMPAAEPSGMMAAPGAQIIDFQPERVVIRTESDRPALLVLAEAWYPGWRAHVDGRETACVRANAWMRAAAVPAGKSEVVLSFRSTYLSLGALVSVATIVLLTWVLLRPGRRHSTLTSRS